MSIKYSALDVANYFIKLSDFTISPMKLQSLVYYAQGWYLAKENNSLINEQIEVWSYGPIIPSIYHKFKKYGNSNIKKLGKQKYINKHLFLEIVTPMINKGDTGTIDFLNVIFKYYNKFSSTELSETKCLEGAPWHTIIKNIEGTNKLLKGTDLPIDIIRNYFYNILCEITPLLYNNSYTINDYYNYCHKYDPFKVGNYNLKEFKEEYENSPEYNRWKTSKANSDTSCKSEYIMLDYEDNL